MIRLSVVEHTGQVQLVGSPSAEHKFVLCQNKTGFNECPPEIQKNNADIPNLNPEVKQEDILPTNDGLLPAISYHQNEDETPQSTCRTLICDTKDLF